METQWLGGVLNVLPPAQLPKPIIEENGKPITRLNPGWSAGPAFKICETLVVLPLKDGDAYRSAWFLGERYERMSNLRNVLRGTDTVETIPGLGRLKVGLRRFLEQIGMPSAEVGALRQLRNESPLVYEQILRAVSPVGDIQVVNVASLDPGHAVRRLYDRGSPLQTITLAKASGLPSLANVTLPVAGYDLAMPLPEGVRITVCRADRPANYRITLPDTPGCLIYVPSLELAVHESPDAEATEAAFRQLITAVLNAAIVLPAAARAQLLETAAAPA